VRIFLAATEDLYRVREDRRVSLVIRDLLLSFNGKAGRIDRAYAAAGPPTTYCVDSGAHFFLSDWFKHGVKPPPAEVEAFQVKLLTELRALPAPPLFVVEMDLQDLYGGRVVQDWRERIWQPAAAGLGAAVCYVWHSVDGEQSWYDLLANPAVRWLGVGGRIAFNGGKGEIDADRLRRMVFDAYRAGKPVHGFAKVKDRVMRHIPFASVDATSWGSGALYGTHTAFNPITGRLTHAAVGRTAQRRNRDAAIGALAIRTRGRLGVGHYTGSDQNTATASISAVYQETAHAYEAYAKWITAWWEARGVDWRTVPGA
jgi:hypothetical protein